MWLQECSQGSLIIRSLRASEMSYRLGKLFISLDNHHQFGKQALATIILTLAAGDEVDAAKKMDEFSA